VKTLIACLVFLFSYNFLSADESLTITTYYPSPYGSYNELSANKLIIGGFVSSVSANGVAHFIPVDLSGACNEGEIYYDFSEHNFKYCDNSHSWKTFGGLGGALLPGSLCGMHDASGTTILVKCSGHTPSSSCPTGYTKKQVAQISGNEVYSCVKN
jgi:hypothetical protein